jgi:hypothetical protein
MFSENVILPSIQMLKDWEEKRMIVGGLFAGQRAGVMIIEATSGEELSGWMQPLPFWDSKYLGSDSASNFQIGSRRRKTPNS